MTSLSSLSDSSGSSEPPPSTNTSLENESGPDAHVGTSFPSLGELLNICNYIPLGCLIVEKLPLLEDQTQTSNWEEWTSSQQNVFSEVNSEDVACALTLHQKGWIRIYYRESSGHDKLILRLYALPQDVGHRFIDRTNRRLYGLFERLLTSIDIDPKTWAGDDVSRRLHQSFDIYATPERGSLFYHFNTLPSPSPDPRLIADKYLREALEDILTNDVPGMHTTMYPYQRRSAGLMLQRESVTTLDLDPRLERRTAPDGSFYFYDPWNIEFLRAPRFYEASRGGILAESMGLGKTVICLALILATKDIPPRIPAAYALKPTRPVVASLSDMAIATIHRTSTPWKVEFNRIFHHSGLEMTGCVNKLRQSVYTYEIPYEPMRLNRRTLETLPPPRRMTISSGTIVVVPRNLCKQWESEIQKHVETGALRVLVMDEAKKPLPSFETLRTFDVILFSKKRFELEDRDGSDEQGRRIIEGKTVSICRCPYIGASRTRDCTCLQRNMVYESPLKHMHFKRLIIDEGHFFGNSRTSTASAVATRIVTADHVWVVSGTPARDLLGVEVDMSTSENLWHSPSAEKSRHAVLQQRREFSEQDKSGAIDSLGTIASGILQVRPWADREANAKWRNHIFRHEGIRRLTHTAFSNGLRRFLENIVVKTRPQDVEQDIEIPPLESSIVRLDPSFYDRATANLFTTVLTANAVTSERTDADYIFHKNNQKDRALLISNLRQSAFFWTGFTEHDAEAMVENSMKYLAKNDISCDSEDRQRLTEAAATVRALLVSDGWKMLGKTHEMGVFIQDWPSESAEHWAFDKSRAPLLTGITQLLSAQKFVNERLDASDPGDGLSGAGIKAMASAIATFPMNQKEKPSLTVEPGDTADASSSSTKDEQLVLPKSGIPKSSLSGEPKRKRSSPAKEASPRKRRAITASSDVSDYEPTSSIVDKIKQDDPRPTRPAPLPYARTRIVGTTSAKLSYLTSQILQYYQDEKILVFYQGENAAYYIAQMLDLLDIKHEIYAKSLQASMKSDYVVRFNEREEERVLLMDIQQAAVGLNLSSASRIYFVNPVCRPYIEAQAIKRAHRIGQKRRVTVETLVLKGSIEEKMLERSKRMTNAEHNDARSLEDDGGIREIIQSARILSNSESGSSGYDHMAPLDVPPHLWGERDDAKHPCNDREQTMAPPTMRDAPDPFSPEHRAKSSSCCSVEQERRPACAELKEAPLTPHHLEANVLCSRQSTSKTNALCIHRHTPQTDWLH